jgi:hypothetical protein
LGAYYYRNKKAIREPLIPALDGEKEWPMRRRPWRGNGIVQNISIFGEYIQYV